MSGASQDEFVAQKENCLFCKIIRGDVSARKVYEDEHLLVILDINPAAKGHCLVLPKEHYPILPLIPFGVMQHIFRKTASVMRAVKEGSLAQGSTVFIANGALAGQMSPHFLFHIIPREDEDLLPFTLGGSGDPAKNAQVCSQVSVRVQKFMSAYLQEMGRSSSALEGAGQEQGSSHLDELIKVINSNDDLRDALIDRPSEVKEAIAKYPKWADLFRGVDIDELSKNLKSMAASKEVGG